MKLLSLLLISISTIFSPAFSQDTTYRSPYKTTWADAAIIGGGIGLTALGVKLINDKKDLTPAELATKTRESIFFLDRGSAGFYSQKADDDSYIPFQASFAMPVIMGLINKNERKHFFQVMTLYVETMAITGSLFTMATGNVYRSRPYVYGDKVDLAMKLDKNSQRAFFAGHTAATGAATFFMAKTYADFNPGSKAIPYVYAFSAAVPALVGYLRYKAGMHFLTDNILGYGVGMAAGILVPQFHKIKGMRNVSVLPYGNTNQKGLTLVYHVR